MPPPKKAAKKTAAKHAAKSDEHPKDMRRAYEHLGRVEVLHSILPKDKTADVQTLTKLAQAEFSASQMTNAADLLRAAEHVSFGVLHSSAMEKNIDAVLLKAIKKEFDHKLEKAQERWKEGAKHQQAIDAFYTTLKSQAMDALDGGFYRQALEFIRAAEALAHVKVSATAGLSDGREPKKLKG